MNKIVYTFLILILLSENGKSQALVITDSTTTSSICFNDGTIQVNASGGTGPYTFTIIGGPYYPNITYPISLPPLTTTFLTMPEGEYTIKVIDAAGNVSYATATVGGNYQFPVLTPIVDINNCIELTVQGGKPPYEYAISSVSTSLGFGSYQSSNIFCVCTGHYWVRVKDSCSNIFTTTQIDVNINLPQISLSTISSATHDTIFTTVTTTSAPPYTYTLHNGGPSITNNTGIFVIPRSCDIDTVILKDRCDSTARAIIDPHALSLGGSSDCQTGNAELTIDSNALAPFTISGPGISGTMTSDNYFFSFDSLPVDTSYTYTVRDSCGNIVSITFPCDSQQIDTTFFYDVCPFDSSLHLRQGQVHYCFPLIVTCLSCTPVQIDTVYSVPARVFTGIDTGVLYRVNLKDGCGLNYTTTYITHYVPLSFTDSIFTCSDFALIPTPRIFSPPIHYTLFDNGVFADSIIANDPVFYHEPPGFYQVYATQPLCYKAGISFNLPPLGGRCIVPMFDSSCTPSYAIFQSYISSPEVFTLVNTLTSQTYTEYEPRGSANYLLFDNVPVGNYNLVSDSGCTEPYILPPYSHTVSVVTSTQCTGQSKITATVNPPINSCNTSQGQYFVLLKDNQYLQSNYTGVFIVSDTGYFVVRLFLSNTTIFVFPAPYDTICPLDTALFYVTVNPIPNVVSVQQFVCGHDSANIPYTIFGGTPPYTVNILGYPTRIVYSTVDTFPDVFPGIYTMVVSDSCGISRSFSVSVVDTCSDSCSIICAFAISDTVICKNSRISLTNLSIGATHYKWLVNGTIYAYISDTTFVGTTPGIDTFTLFSYVGTCKDSSRHILLVQDTLYNTGISDTFLCLPFDLNLNTHNPNSQWSTGVNDSLVTISLAGSYWVQVANACGSTRDSFVVSQRQSPLFDLTTPKADICDDQPDSAILTATLTDSTGPLVLFVWNTGYTDSSAYRSQIIVYQAGSYHVLVTDGFCPLDKDIAVDTISCDSQCLAEIAIPNIFSPNGDGRNDTFYVLHLCQIIPFYMHIYDRWGQEVFTSSTIEQGWDGKYKGIPQPEGVYWYWVSISVDGARPERRSGTVTLVR